MGENMKDVRQILWIFDPLPLVCICSRSTVLNPRNLPYYVCFWATPSPLSVGAFFMYGPLPPSLPHSSANLHFHRRHFLPRLPLLPFRWRGKLVLRRLPLLCWSCVNLNHCDVPQIMNGSIIMITFLSDLIIYSPWTWTCTYFVNELLGRLTESLMKIFQHCSSISVTLFSLDWREEGKTFYSFSPSSISECPQSPLWMHNLLL